MDEILNKSVAEMAGLSFACSCGRRHSVDIKKIIIGSGIMDDIAATVKEFSEGKKVFFIADNNTYAVYGEKVECYYAHHDDKYIVTAKGKDRINAVIELY